MRMAPRNWIENRPVVSADGILALVLIGLDVLARLLSPTPNFVPIAATALFAGAVLRSRFMAAAVPLAALILSDSILGFHDWRVMAVVYAALVFPAAIGMWGRPFRSPIVFLPLALSSSLIFFVTTNFAVWMFSGMYAHDLAGLGACYAMALPFLQNTILGDLFWTSLLFGGYSAVRLVLGVASCSAAKTAF